MAANLQGRDREGGSTRLFWIALFVAGCLVGFFLRLWQLDLKPLHSDEAVNGFFLIDLLERGDYHYNPENFHGPLFYYLGASPALLARVAFGDALGGHDELILRLGPALAGGLMLLLLVPLRRFWGWGAVCLGAWMLAWSPVGVYVARTAIHESYLVSSTLALVSIGALYFFAGENQAVLRLPRLRRSGSGWRDIELRPYLPGAMLCCVALLYSTKETAVITLGALVTALTFAAYSYWRQHESQAMPFATWLRSRVTKCHPRALVHLAAIVLCAYLSLSTLAAVTRSAIAPTAADFWAVVVTGSAPLWAIFAASTTALVFFLLRACRRDWGYGLLLLLLCWTVSIVLATALVVLVAHERTGRAWAFWSELTGASQRLGVWPLARTVALAAFLAVPVAAWVAARKLRRRCTPWWLGLQAAQRSWIAGGAVAATLLFLLFCSFGANPGGLWDMVYTQLVWITRSSVEAETGQEKAFPYYLEILWTYERPIAALLMVLPVAVLAVSRAWRRLALALLCLGLAAAAWRSGMEAPALALLGVALLAASLHSAHSTFFSMWALVVLWIYSAIPYKTPWLLVNISLPLSLAAASLSSHLLTAPAIKGKAPVVALAAILCLGLVPFQAELGREGEPTEETGWWRMGWNLNFETPTDRRHPVVYHQTLPEVRELVALLEDLAQRDPDLVLHIVTNDYHPVPFYLHGRPIRLLYHIDAKLPDPLEPAMLIWQFQEPEVDQLGGRYHKERFEMRPGVVNTLMIAEERWAAAMEKDGS